MSLARLYTTKKVRKDWTCDKCGAPIRKGIDGRISYAVGFRGFERTRCLRPECYPTLADRESSAVAEIYAAIEGMNLAECGSLEDVESAVGDVQAAIDSVKDEYESNEMFEINEVLQERVSMLEEASQSLDGWSDGLDEAPEEEPDCDTCQGAGLVPCDDHADGDETCEDCEGGGEKDCPDCNGTGSQESNEDAVEEWLESVREAAQEAVNGLELP